MGLETKLSLSTLFLWVEEMPFAYFYSNEDNIMKKSKPKNQKRKVEVCKTVPNISKILREVGDFFVYLVKL
jgi:hypothetical protein